MCHGLLRLGNGVPNDGGKCLVFQTFAEWAGRQDGGQLLFQVGSDESRGLTLHVLILCVGGGRGGLLEVWCKRGTIGSRRRSKDLCMPKIRQVFHGQKKIYPDDNGSLGVSCAPKS